MVLIITSQLFLEIETVLNRPKIKQKYQLNIKQIQSLLDGIKLNSTFVTPLNSRDLPFHSRDPQDEKLLTAALGGNVDYLITGDKDLLSLAHQTTTLTLKIITVQEFLTLLSDSEPSLQP